MIIGGPCHSGRSADNSQSSNPSTCSNFCVWVSMLAAPHSHTVIHSKIGFLLLMRVFAPLSPAGQAGLWLHILLYVLITLSCGHVYLLCKDGFP
ncbi:hypothetical protein PoB_003991200 [Plakobranchus ocellatus]|uniref:Uncharacterized protein n=1 Tax=Plakobranchus ocellatus TaxID=259542 RepID=A0AAV4B2G4_9GAST|nr:hypothetical protein PoB_003991200 [Plakobranchus ocellatus]